jgi:hypothetical protein
MVTQLVKKSPRLLWNLKFRYRIHKGPLLDNIPSQLKPAHVLTYRFFMIQFNVFTSTSITPLAVFFIDIFLQFMYMFRVHHDAPMSCLYKLLCFNSQASLWLVYNANFWGGSDLVSLNVVLKSCVIKFFETYLILSTVTCVERKLTIWRPGSLHLALCSQWGMEIDTNTEQQGTSVTCHNFRDTQKSNTD